MLTPNQALEKIQLHLSESAAVKQRMAETLGPEILRAASLLVDSLGAGHKLLLCGNGGSAADCQHMAAELVSKMSRDLDRPGLPVLALTTDCSFLTAYANDYGYDGVFSRQITAFGRPGDTLLGISTSGNSRNVIEGIHAARAIGMKVITLTGAGGAMPPLADVALCVPSTDTQYIQEAHLAVEHLLCFIVEHSLFPATTPRAGSPSFA